MKILVVQDHLRSGGTERQSLLLAAAFAAAGHAVTLLTFRPGGALDPRPPTRFSRIVLQPFDSGLDWWAPELLATARRVAPDVVLCMGRMANCYAGRLQRGLPRAAVVGTLRTGRSLPWLFRRSLTQVRHVVANSQAARQRLLQQMGPGLDRRLTVIPNALVFPAASASPSARSAAAEAFRATQGATPQTAVLLCVAMFRPGKNQHHLVDIVQRLPAELDWQLWLAGDGPERGRCAAAVRQAGLERRVRLLGWVADPTPLYAAADLAVHASQRESLSNFLIEAQAHGLPVVAYDTLGVAETFQRDVSGRLIPARRPDDFAAAVLNLVTDPSLRATMARQAQVWARREFSAERQVEAYLDLFAQLVTRSGQ